MGDMLSQVPAYDPILDWVIRSAVIDADVGDLLGVEEHLARSERALVSAGAVVAAAEGGRDPSEQDRVAIQAAFSRIANAAVSGAAATAPPDWGEETLRGCLELTIACANRRVEVADGEDLSSPSTLQLAVHRAHEALRHYVDAWRAGSGSADELTQTANSIPIAFGALAGVALAAAVMINPLGFPPPDEVSEDEVLAQAVATLALSRPARD